MSTSAPSNPVQDAVDDLVPLMVQINDTLRQIAISVQALATVSD